MSKSDAHASKCSKLNISFKDEYPTEYDEYVAAREQYNVNEAEIQKLKDAPVEEPQMHIEQPDMEAADEADTEA